MDSFHISFMQLNDIQEAAKALSIAMLNNPLHVAVFQGDGENERLKIERMFYELLQHSSGIVYIVKEHGSIVGVMRMKSCAGQKEKDRPKPQGDEKDINWRKSIWHWEWSNYDPVEQHWHLGPIGVLPSHRRLGIGSRLMEVFCNEVDKCSAQAYLETDLDENVAFYKKFGFEIVSKSNIFKVENRYMIRNAPTGL